ncbi:hypothetical protein HPB47_003805 [Ixodes persulcatus]|uniref:Uncharacterized protein n=1 Tax=Ixodes persulcatus TaxID=34615 RepID=A0AC60PHF1_IXOPE|nr:hypothetical protein HPB47_003805 [Ixodes persulcatus]
MKVSSLFGNQVEKVVHQENQEEQTKTLQPNSFENRVLKSFLGISAGALLTVLLNLALQRIFHGGGALTFLIVLAVGTGLMLGSAFSSTVRCLMLLLLPQLFSREGRMALLSYIYFLVLTGPSENFTANVEVLSRGLSCGQEKVANETRRMLDIATSPLKVGAIRRAVQWLYNLVNVCNRRMGEPYEKCRKPLNDAHEDCLSMMPSILSWLCSPVKLVEYVCYVAKAITVLCAIPAIIIDFVKVQVIDRIERAMKRFLERAYTAFYVNITVTHEYNYSLEFSRSPSEVRGEIVRELRARVAVFTGIFRLLSNGVFLAVLYVVYTATQYHFRYLREEDFDNYYVTWMVVAVDKSRARKGLETLLPLRSREKRHSVEPFSPHLTDAELTDLTANLRSLVVSGAYSAVAMLLDYTMFRLLSFSGRWERST